MLNVGSNYTSFSNYSPAYRAQRPVQRGHQGGGGQRPGTPPALPGLGAARHGAAGGRDPGGGTAGTGRGGDRCAAILGCLLGGLGQAAAAQPGREAGRGLPGGLAAACAGGGSGGCSEALSRRRPSVRSFWLTTQNTKQPPSEGRHRPETGSGSPGKGPQPRSRAQRPGASPPPGRPSLFTWLYLASCSRELFSSPFTVCWAAGGKLFRPRLLHSSTLGLG